MADWQQIEESLAKLPASAAKRRFLDATNYYGQVVRMDDQGRLLIPQLLREAASLVGDVAVMGIEKKLVVANDARLRAQITEHPATDEDIESLGVVGL
jgi:MraZ protein